MFILLTNGGFVMKKFMVLFISVIGVFLFTDRSVYANLEMYRMYNSNTGEHFYTANMTERDHLVGIGWRYEGIGWIAPDSGNPVYRLYNPFSGDHIYTASLVEKNQLVQIGWRYEGVGWYSALTNAMPIYRAFNPNVQIGSHNYTYLHAEQSQLVRLGWIDEGIGWYGVKTDLLTDDKGNQQKIDTTQIAKYMYDYVNNERRQLGVSELKWNEQLVAASKLRVDELTVKYSHNRLDGSSPYTALTQVGIPAQIGSKYLNAGGENIAYFAYDSNISNEEIAQMFFSVWKNSEAHYKNMIQSNRTDFACAFTVKNNRIYGQQFFMAYLSPNVIYQ